MGRYLFVFAAVLAMMAYSAELLEKDSLTIDGQHNCKVAFEVQDGKDVLVVHGTTPGRNTDPPRNLYMNFVLKLKTPISLVDRTMLMQADFSPKGPSCLFFVRGFIEKETDSPWSFALDEASMLNTLPNQTLVMTTGMSGVARWERNVVGNRVADKVSAIKIYMGTKAINHNVTLTIKSIRTEKAMKTEEVLHVGFSRNKDNWELVEKVTSLPTETLLAKEGKPQVDIIHPDSPAGANAAEKVAAAIAALCDGKAPKCIPGTLDQRVPKRTAIMLGNIFDNPAMLTTYTRCAIIADKKWPGPGAHVVRTVFEPFKKGADIIALEASDDAGLEKAAAAFVKLLKAKAKQENGVLSVPRLFEMKLPKGVKTQDFKKSHVADGLVRAQALLDEGAHTSLGGYLATIGKRYLSYQNPLDAQLYAEVCRLYRKSAVGDPRKYGGAWGFDSDFPSVYAIAGWDLIEHDPVLTEQDRLDVTQTIQSWLNMQIVAEAAGGVAGTGVTSNHLTFCSMGTMMGGLYFSKYYPKLKTPKDWLAIIKHNFERQTVAGKVFDDCDSYQWLTWKHCCVYSMVMPDDNFFTKPYNEKGSVARQGAFVCGQTMDNLWTQAPYGDDNGWASSQSHMPFLRMFYAATQEPLAGTLLALKCQHLGKSPNPLQESYEGMEFNDVGDFNGEYRIALTTELNGLYVNPLDAKYYDTIACPMPVPPREKCFDKLSYRSRLEPDALYALIDGVNNGGHRHEDGNSVLRLTYLNREWLMENSYIKPQQKFHNSLLLLVNGEAFSLPDYIEMLSHGENDELCWAFTRANGFGPSDWTRYHFWLKDEEAMVVIDELDAKKKATYQIRQRWNGLGEYTPKNDGMQLTQQGISLRFQCWDNTLLTVHENKSLGDGWESYPYAAATSHVLDQNVEEDFKKGARLVMGVVIHGAASDSVSPWVFKKTAKGFTLDTGSRAYEIGYSESGVLNCSAKKSATKLVEPPVPAAAKAKSFPGKLLTLQNAIQLYDAYSMLDATQSNIWLTSPEFKSIIPFTLTGDAPGIENIFNSKNANDIENAVDGTGTGTENSTMYPIGKEPELTITFENPQIVNSVENLMWWATKNRKGVQFKPATITAFTSVDGKNFTKAGSYDATGETHKDFVSPISMPISLAGASKKPIKALRLNFVPQAGAAIYINEIRVKGLPGSEEIKEKLKSRITCVMPFEEKGKQYIALSTRYGEMYVLDDKAKPLYSFDAGSSINDVAAADIDGDGAVELLLACEDTTLKVCRKEGTMVWTHKFPFYRRRARCTLVRVADLEQNGQLTILAGCDNWRVHALDVKGSELWNFEVIHPTRALEVADINSDGKLEILCGTQYYYATVLDYQGRKLRGGIFARGNKGVAGLLSGEKDSTFVVGEDKGIITFFRPLNSVIAQFATGDEVMRTVAVKRSDTAKKEDLLAASLNGFAYRFDCNGKLLWSKGLASSVLLCRALPDGSGVFGTANGNLVVIDEKGDITARYELGSPITDIRFLAAGKKITLLAATATGNFSILK